MTQQKWTGAEQAVHVAVANGIKKAGASISPAVFPNVAGVIVDSLFGDPAVRTHIRAFCDERDVAEKAARSAKGTKK